MHSISKRAQQIPTSAVRELAIFERQAIDNGIDIIHLNIGAPDLEVSNVFFDSINNLSCNLLPYVNSQGIAPLIEEVQKYYSRLGATFTSDEIFVTNGGSEALLYALIATCDAESEVLVPEPFYSNYNTIARIINVNLVPVITCVEDGFHLPSKDKVIAAITKNTKAILISNPANPTGVVYTKEEVLMLCDIAQEYGLWIIADEVYREFIYGGFETYSFSVVEKVKNQVIIIDSISKRFSACGARIGFLLSSNQEVNQTVLKLCQSRLSISTIDQLGAVALYQNDLDYINRSIPLFKERRDTICALLSEIDGVTLSIPEGAFYIMVDLPVQDATHFSKWLLTEFNVNKRTVMLTPGKGFYITPDKGLNEVRIAYVLNINEIKEAVSIIKAGLNVYKEK